MRAVIRDIQDYINDGFRTWNIHGDPVLDANQLRAYLLACLITSGAYDDLDDPFGALRHELAGDRGQG